MNARHAAVSVGLVGVCLAASHRLVAADHWIDVTSPHFTVISNNGDKSARSVAWQMEQFRSAMEQAWPWSRGQPDRPVLVIGVKNADTMKAFVPDYWEKGGGFRPDSVAVIGDDRYYILLRADVTEEGPEGVNPYQQSYWTYANITLSSSFNYRLPLWFTRGLSAVLSNTNVTDTEVQFGRALPSYMQELNTGGRYSLDELFTATRSSPVFSSSITLTRFDAQTWALMHYLLFGVAEDAGTRNARIDALAAALTAGTPSAKAVEEVYGPLPALDFAYRAYIRQGLLRYMRLKADMRVDRKDFGARSVDPADVLATRASVLVATDRLADARQAIADARQLAPQLAASYDAEGQMLEREQQPEQARAAYGKAVQLGSQDFYSYVRLAALTPRAGAAPATLTELRTVLIQAVGLNGFYAPAQQLLCNVLLQMNRPGEALAPARKAVELEPGHAYMHLSLATVLQRLAQRDEALREAVPRWTLRKRTRNGSRRRRSSPCSSASSVGRAPV
jgi:tetratricopeptide (TPR) repeat protein